MSETAGARKHGIALCLSGGGLRATLFHLGVVKHLRQLEIDGAKAITRVTDIYSVSGGSILAAHMLANWSSYSSPDDDEFSKVEQELLTFARRNIRDRILRRWILLGPACRVLAAMASMPLVGRIVQARPDLGTRTYWLQQEYEALLKAASFSRLEQETGVPTGHILTTSFQTGELCSFSGADFEIELHDRADPTGPRRAPCGHMRLSFAVAASSAFPPMFPPMELTEAQLANPRDEAFRNALLLSDGGVFDNLGIEKFKRDHGRGTVRPVMLIISDAGGSFRAQTGKTYAGVVARNVRASDILMHRIADLAKDDIEDLDDPDKQSAVHTIRISETVTDPALTRSVQQRMRLVRTDLDRFDPALARLLVEHGTRLAKAQIGDTGGSPTTALAGAVDARAATVERYDSLSEAAASRRWGSLFFDRDWTVLLLWFAVAAFATAVYLAVNHYSAKLTAARTREDAERTSKEQALEKLQADMRQIREALTLKDVDRANRIAFDGIAFSQSNIEAAKSQVASTGLIDQVPTPLGTAGYRQKVYIQFAGFQRSQIANLNQTLRSSGWDTQSTSGERTVLARKLNEVRYSGANQQPATALADAINAARGTPGVTKPKPFSIINGDVLEVWVSPVPGERSAPAQPGSADAASTTAE
ncbi:hypothetical protein CHU93_02090 [Sandarakinorhabdus cyanobacteriorum]|uniref:PNPLA domain-containing protein n=1 Tax=Sandarakinorhabdus cyanobacteriorum TaxID=1981098 RepID=A0A255YZX7_9SPHN|nr:patatin-like phospholipase family protein [Sandarakinorhabdus cyanobacteriorum]OYQ34758.1 hypothetical protein CHU93_02090 [Sandarakinorhabdus cyanobacteriorum]